jgi:SOS-response transcriptional repressor LexA
MTPRQRDVLDAVAAHWRAHRCAPSYREIADAIGARSKATPYRLVTALVARGYLERRGYARSLRVRPSPPLSRESALAAAAALVFDCIIDEDLDAGEVVVVADAIGELDIALAEMREAGL